MIVAIHQPNYMPWAGYFYKILKSDIFIFLDDVQYTKNSFINRNRIKTANGVVWLTAPVTSKISDNINEVKFSNMIWKEKHVKTLYLSYKNAPYFKQYAEDIFSILREPTEYLYETNIKLIKYIAINVLGATCKFMNSSDIGSQHTSDERLIELIHKVGGTCYLSGKGGANYQSEEKFRESDIELKYTEYEQIEYKQLWGEFVASMAIIDLVFNCGEDTRHIILGEVSK